MLTRFRRVCACFVLAPLCASMPGPLRAQKRDAHTAQKHNVILFVADGLRRGSVTAEDMPTFWELRRRGVDFRNSHSLFPTFTTANASAIATGHGLGDTGDYSNSIWPGIWLTSPVVAANAQGALVPFLENDGVLANMNARFHDNYLGEPTLLTLARQQGYAVASLGKLGPTAIQQNEAVRRDQDGRLMTDDGALVIDDATGHAAGLPLPPEILEALGAQGLAPSAPLRSNGFGDGEQSSNGFSGDAVTPGTLEPNHLQQQWFADVATRVLLPRFTKEDRPFLLLFWSRDPDGTQHNQGDSLQQMSPGINGPTTRRALQNADHDLKQLLDWLDAHPAVKAVTDVLVTSDHGFATISRRELAADGTATGEPSAALDYGLMPGEKPETKGTLPPGFLAIDLAIREHLRVFDADRRVATGPSVFRELAIGGERSDHPELGSALLATDPVQRLDGGDAQLIVAANGGSDLIYAPTGDAATVQRTVATLGGLDYVGGLFVDKRFCGESMAACPGALPLDSVGLVGSSKVPRPAIVVSFKNFHLKPGDLQSALQISDTSLQEGQGMHGGFGRDQTWNNMAAMGPDFKAGFVDELPVSNADLTPTLVHILGLPETSTGSLRGRIAEEALKGGPTSRPEAGKVEVSRPSANGLKTILEWQEWKGERYYDQACFITGGQDDRPACK